MDGMLFAIYKLTPLFAVVCATILFISRNSRRATFGGARPLSGFARVKPHTKYPPARHPADHHFEWSRGRVLQWYQIISSPKAQASSKASTRAGRGLSIPAHCSSCFLAFGTVTRPTLLWAGRNTGSSAKDQFLTRPLAAESCNQLSPYCTQGWSPICCGASSGATPLRSGRNCEPAPPVNDGSSPALRDWLPAKRSTVRPPHR